MQPHVVNRLYSFLLIALGFFGFIARYLEVGDYQFTAFIPSVFGVILLFMTKGIKNENRVIAHIAVVLTLILGLMITSMLIRSGFQGDRKSYIFLTVAVASFGALAVYVKGFIDKKKQKQAGLDS